MQSQGDLQLDAVIIAFKFDSSKEADGQFHIFNHEQYGTSKLLSWGQSCQKRGRIGPMRLGSDL
jgi:hypothetical protein